MKTPLRWAAALLAALACATPKPPPPPPPPPAEPAAAAEPAPPAPAPQHPGVDRTTPPELGPTPPLRLPGQRRFALRNGLRVRLVEEHRLPIVALDLVVDAGASRDPRGLEGLASFTADMLTEGTRTRTATQLSDQLGLLGASLAARAGSDASTLDGECLAEQLPAFLELFADVVRNPAFTEADFRRVQDERRVRLLQQRDEPAWVGATAFVPLFWGSDHPYGHRIIGTEAALARTRREDLARFQARYWRPANAELVVVGDVTELELRPLLEARLGTWPAGKAAPPLTPQDPAAPNRMVLIDKPGASQTYLGLGALGVERRSDDYVAVSVLFEILGGGTSSRLFRTLREAKGYTYGIHAVADARKLGGASLALGHVKAEVTGPALHDLLEEVQRVVEEPVTADELREAKEGIVRALPARFTTVSGIADQLGELAEQGLPDDYWSGYAAAVERVTVENVQRVARKFLAPDRVTKVLVGPRALVLPQLEALKMGEVQVERPERQVNPPLPRKPAR